MNYMEIMEYEDPLLITKPNTEEVLTKLNFNIKWMDFQYSHSGILIWHILEDRIFMSEGFCRLMGISEAGVSNLENLFHSDPECEFRNYLRNILNQVCNDEIEDSNFKTRIPGINKEIFGSVQLFDRENLGISDLVLICWKS